ncbi:MAG: hypothetical protein HKN13_15360, partial [Rhodothermales bacterium]|nr:hypothetical protein [Rhodothermales bacterium]
MTSRTTRRILLTALACGALSVAAAQEISKPIQVTSESPALHGVVHLTDVLNMTPQARRWLEEFHEAKRQGLIPYASKTRSEHSVGDTVSFRTQNRVPGRWSNTDFVFKSESEVVKIYVAVAELGNISDSEVTLINSHLTTGTPQGSVNPTQGIIANENDIFGNPPNVDGDGVTDVLIYDIENVLGFVSGADLSATGPGNMADVLHIGSRHHRDLSDRLRTIAHEYQHLIHFNYDGDELRWVNEGLSDYAAVLNGYAGRPIRYLAYPSLRNTWLFWWDQLLINYEKAGLFVTYLAQRSDPMTAGSITRDPANGRSGMNSALGAVGLSLEDILVDFHSTTLLNGTGLTTDTRFEFASEAYRDNGLEGPDLVVNGAVTSSTVRRDTVFGGGVRFYVWKDVEDFRLTVDPIVEAGQTEQLTLGRSRPRVIIARNSSPVEIVD